MRDTSSRADAVRLQALQAMSPQRRLALAVGWSASLREMIRGHLRLEFPEASEATLRRLLADRWLGVDLAAQVYGPLPSYG